MARQRARRRRQGFSVLPALESLEPREMLSAEVELLKDIASGNPDGVFSRSSAESYKMMAELNGWVYFQANDGTSGSELWRTDGTAANTQLFVDINPGSTGSDPRGFYAANGKLYFSAQSPGGFGLFVTDGTTTGTFQLTTVEVGNAVGAIGTDVIFHRFGSTSRAGAFWRSDGTVSGTVQFASSSPPEFGGVREVVIFENTVVYDSLGGRLYRVDHLTGTQTQIASSPINSRYLTVFNGDLYFSATTSENEKSKLWKLASPTSTPALVQTAGSSLIAETPVNLVATSSFLYFAGLTTNEGIELWRTDGSTAGTILVKDIWPGHLSNFNTSKIVAVGDTVYFSANDGVTGEELWKSSGTEATTVLVKDIVPGPDSSFPGGFFNWNGELAFNSVWTSDGTSAGTIAATGVSVSIPDSYTTLGNLLIFAAQNSTVGRELFVLRQGDRLATPQLTGPQSTSSSLRPTVTWDAVPNATNYEVWIRNQSTGQNQVLLQQVADTSLTPSFDLGIGRFTVWVRALATAAAGSSDWSVPRYFEIKAPVTHVATVPNPQNGLSTISWAVLAGAVTYDVWVDRLDVAVSQFYRNTSLAGTSVSPASLPRGSYRVWIRGIAADGRLAAWSSPLTFSSHPVPAITSSTNPTFDTTPTISWTAVSGAASYEVYVLAINGNAKAFHQKNISGTSFTWPVVAPGPYRFWVRVTGDTEWSAATDLNTAGQTSLQTPSGSITDRTPTFSWKAVEGAVRYELWVDLLGFDEKIIYRTNLTSASFTPTSDLPTGNYRVWVRAVSSATSAPWSTALDFTIADAAPQKSEPLDEELLASVFEKLMPWSEVPDSDRDRATARRHNARHDACRIEGPADHEPIADDISERPVDLDATDPDLLDVIVMPERTVIA